MSMCLPSNASKLYSRPLLSTTSIFGNSGGCAFRFCSLCASIVNALNPLVGKKSRRPTRIRMTPQIMSSFFIAGIRLLVLFIKLECTYRLLSGRCIADDVDERYDVTHRDDQYRNDDPETPVFRPFRCFVCIFFLFFDYHEFRI